MIQSITKNEKLIALVGISLTAAFLVTFSKLNNKPKSLSQFETNETINYEMARPQDVYADYTLDGREIDSHYEGLQDTESLKNLEKAKAIAKNNKLAAAKAAVTNKPNKTADAKKIVAAKVIIAKNFESKNAQAISKTENAAEIDVSKYQKNQSQYQQPLASAAPSADLISEPDMKDKKSYSKWRFEIFANPTKEILGQFIGAYRKGDVTATEFQAMAQELIEQDDIQIKGLGLMVLRSQPSVASLSQLVFAQEQLPPALQAYVEQAYAAYLQPQNVFIFGEVFLSKNKKLIVKSLSILSSNLQKIRSGDFTAFVDARNRRDAEVPVISVNNFKDLLPSLTRISTSQEPEVSGPATQVLGFIQNDVNLAGI